MSGFNMDLFVKDFSERTNENTEVLNYAQQKYGKNINEVTHLINSLFGLVIIPHEAYYDTAKSFSIATKYSDDLRKIDKIVEECKRNNKYYCDYDDKDQTAVQFIHHIRNSLSHGGNSGIMFCPLTEAERIKSVIFFDTDERYNKDNPHKFCVELRIRQLRDFVRCTNNLFIKIEEEYRDDGWFEKVEEYRALFDKKVQNYVTNIDYIINGEKHDN